LRASGVVAKPAMAVGVIPAKVTKAPHSIKGHINVATDILIVASSLRTIPKPLQSCSPRVPPVQTLRFPQMLWQDGDQYSIDSLCSSDESLLNAATLYFRSIY
jgi:hypothetical protein